MDDLEVLYERSTADYDLIVQFIDQARDEFIRSEFGVSLPLEWFDVVMKDVTRSRTIVAQYTDRLSRAINRDPTSTKNYDMADVLRLFVIVDEELRRFYAVLSEMYDRKRRELAQFDAGHAPTAA